MSIIIPTASKRLSSSEYERPEKTITDVIQTKKDIEEQLKNFSEITDEDLNFVNVNTQLKYISYDKKNKKELFRFGGLLLKVNKDYVLLSGKEGLRFSVQRYTRNDKNEIIHITRFFKKINDKDLLKIEFNDITKKAEKALTKQSETIEKQNKEIAELKKLLKSRK